MKYGKLSNWALQSRFIFHWIHVACIPKIRPLVKRTVKAIASRLYVSRKSVSPDADYLDYRRGSPAAVIATLFSPVRGEKGASYAPDSPRSARASGISIDVYLTKCLSTERYIHTSIHTHIHIYILSLSLSLSPSVATAFTSITRTIPSRPVEMRATKVHAFLHSPFWFLMHVGTRVLLISGARRKWRPSIGRNQSVRQ